jgi:hypothetical protein
VLVELFQIPQLDHGAILKINESASLTESSHRFHAAVISKSGLEADC